MVEDPTPASSVYVRRVTSATKVAQLIKDYPWGSIGAFVLLTFLVLGLFAPWLSPFEPMRIASGPPLTPPSAPHLLGTDNLGRDLLSGILHGARFSLLVGFLAAATSVTVGTAIGATAGYLGGAVDNVLMRITEFFQVVPRLFLAILLVALFGPSIWNIVLVVGLVSWPQVARLVRAEFLSLRQTEFVLAAIALGTPGLWIVVRHLLPNVLAVLLVTGSLQVGSAILLEAGLSFVGLGDPTTASWGTMLYSAQGYLSVAWWMVVFPGAAISSAVLAVNLLGDSLSERFTPWLRAIRRR